MLVLTRRINQSIMIGDDVEITVLAVSGEKVRIGIEAPRGGAGLPAGGLPADRGREGRLNGARLLELEPARAAR